MQFCIFGVKKVPNMRLSIIKLIPIIAVLFMSQAICAQNLQEDPDLQYAVDLLKPGSDAPAFTLNDLQGKAVSLKDFKGKTVVLVFWATWCPDCRAEVPEIKAMHAAADPAKTVFVSVSFDRSFDTLVKYADENELPGVQLFDPSGKKESAIGADYHVKWIPSLYVIGPDGKVQLATVVASKVAAFLSR